MATIIRRTNPDVKVLAGGRKYVCSVCTGKWNSWDEAVACAVADFARRGITVEVAA